MNNKILVGIVISVVGTCLMISGILMSDARLEGFKSGIDHVYESCKVLGFHYNMDSKVVLVCATANMKELQDLVNPDSQDQFFTKPKGNKNEIL